MDFANLSLSKELCFIFRAKNVNLLVIANFVLIIPFYLNLVVNFFYEKKNKKKHEKVERNYEFKKKTKTKNCTVVFNILQ